MRHFFTFIFLLFFVQITLAQYTRVINSKRPGFSDSPYSLGTGVYQIEAGLFYKDIGNYLDYTFIYGVSTEPSFITHTYSSSSYGSDIMLRSGLFFERLELNIDMAVRNENRDVNLRLTDKVNNKTANSNFNTSSFGLNKFDIGAKYLVYKPTYTDKSKEIRSWKARHSFDFRRLIPAVAVYAGINTNIFLDKLYKNTYLQDFIFDYNKELEKENEENTDDPDYIDNILLASPTEVPGIGARFAVYTQNDLSERWIILFNFIADKVFTDFMEGSFIGTTTYALNEKLSVFGEGQLFFRTQEGVPNDFQFGAGVAYLFNQNMQLDISGRMILDERGDNTYLLNTGVSWRIDHHKDRIIKQKAKNNNNVVLEDEKRGFFNTITFGIFARKKTGRKVKNPNKVKSVKAKERNLEPPVNKKAQKAKKKRNKQLIKEQKRKEKAQKKYYKKAEKA